MNEINRPHDQHPQCFWDPDGDPCNNEATQTIYWDGTDEPICEAHLPEAHEAIQDIINMIDSRMG